MKKMKSLLVALSFFVMMVGLIGCASTEAKAFGIMGDDTISLNLTRDPNVGTIYVTYVDGVATGAEYSPSIMGFGGKAVWVNPLHVKLTGMPIVFTVLCPVVTGTGSSGKKIITYKQTELRLTKLADIKAGDVVTLRWMYQTQTFAFLGAAGNIIEQIIPDFY